MGQRQGLGFVRAELSSTFSNLTPAVLPSRAEDIIQIARLACVSPEVQAPVRFFKRCLSCPLPCLAAWESRVTESPVLLEIIALKGWRATEQREERLFSLRKFNLDQVSTKLSQLNTKFMSQHMI